MMFIYLIAGNEDRVKIGISVDPQKRLKQLQTGNPTKLEILYLMEIEDKYCAKYEAYLHKEYAYKRLVGEWFSFKPEEALNLIKYHEMMFDSLKHEL